MGFSDAIRVGASGAASALTIDRSARFRGATDQRFDRTLSSTSSSYTVSFWFKGTPVNTNFSRGLFTLGPANNTDVAGVVINNNDQLIFYGGNGAASITTTRVFRDTSAWYYFTYSVNSNNFTAYINGESLQTGTVRSLDTTSNGFRLGGWWGGYDLFRGYIADFYLIDGSALTPSSFTETNAETGQLIPKKYTGSFGTSGAHLLFDDNSGTTATTLGKDSSGNGNNFTPISFAVSDAVKDSPTNNFCTFNPLDNRDNLTLSEGNLKATGAASWDQIKSTIGVSSGKWYFEIEPDTIGTTAGWFGGIHELKAGANYVNAYWSQNIYTVADYGYVYAVQDDNRAATNTSEKSFTSNITAGDIVGFRVDLDNNELSISVNGSDKGKVYDIQPGITYTPAVNMYASGTSSILNCGQDSTFVGAVSSGGNADANGIGDFKYAVPSGYKAICSANLPDPTIKLPNKHFDTVLYTGNGGTQSITSLEFQPDWSWLKTRNQGYHHRLFDAVRGVGKSLRSDSTGAEETGDAILTAFNSNGFSLTQGAYQYNASGVTYVGWNWNAGDTDGKTYTVKVVSDSGNKYRFDNFGTSAVTLDLAEGGTYIFNMDDSSNASHPFSIGTAANGTVYASGITYFLDGVSKTYSQYTSGFYSATTRRLHITVPASAPQLYYWCSVHSGMGGAINTNSTLGSSNFDGSTQSTVKANATAGFSIVSYKGNGSSGNTVGHGLGVAPNLLIVKNRDYSDVCLVGSDKLGFTKQIYLNLNNASATSAEGWNNTAPTSSVFTLGNGNATNRNTDDHIAYVFSEVAGYSKFGKYTGNGSSSGPFLFTGFRPAWVLIKNSGASGFDWVLQDATRSPFNVANEKLNPNTSAAAQTGNDRIDILSNGFKCRDSSAGINANNSSYIYLAFAESPFKNARAR